MSLLYSVNYLVAQHSVQILVEAVIYSLLSEEHIACDTVIQYTLVRMGDLMCTQYTHKVRDFWHIGTVMGTMVLPNDAM